MLPNVGRFISVLKCCSCLVYMVTTTFIWCAEMLWLFIRLWLQQQTFINVLKCCGCLVQVTTTFISMLKCCSSLYVATIFYQCVEMLWLSTTCYNNIYQPVEMLWLYTCCNNIYQFVELLWLSTSYNNICQLSKCCSCLVYGYNYKINPKFTGEPNAKISRIKMKIRKFYM